jgi:DNA-binding transcriptional LysR family regulator
MAWMFDQLPGVEPATRVNATTHLLHALKAGLGVAPYGCIVADLEPDLIRVLPPIPPPRPAVWMVTRAELKDTPRARAFVDFFMPFMQETRRALVERGQALQDRKLAELEAALAAGG